MKDIYYSIDFNYRGLENKKVSSKIQELVNLFMDESKKSNKVAFYYEDITSGIKINYYPSVCFYAASTIKILIPLILYRKALNKEINLNDEVLVTLDDLKVGSGILINNKEDKKYTIAELIRLSIVESDNTAYIKLVDLIGKDNIAAFGKSLGALHTMEGIDSFGIINCYDLKCYFKAIKDFIEEDNIYSKQLEDYLLNPSFKIVKNNKYPFVRKYGEYSIAYHEAGYVKDEREYYVFILTQLNETNYKEEFVNKAYTLIEELHEVIKEVTNA